MKRYSSSKDTGAPCQRCMILRVFLGMVLFVVILGLAGGNELSYFKYITTQKVANAIMIIGFIIFIFKIIFWYWFFSFNSKLWIFRMDNSWFYITKK